MAAVRFRYYLIAHTAPFEADPLPTPEVVASITCDPRLVRKLNPYDEMRRMAGKLGLIDFEITTAEAQDLPGHQLGLPFPRPRAKH